MDLTLYREDIEEIINLVDAKRNKIYALLKTKIGTDDEYQALQDYGNLSIKLAYRLRQGLHGKIPV